MAIFKKENKNFLDCSMFENFSISVRCVMFIFCLYFNVKLVAGQGDKHTRVCKSFKSILSALHKENKVSKRNMGDP